MIHSDEVIDGRYRLLHLIGSGGMGVVWRAHDERLGRDVAVKRLHLNLGPDDEEAEVASRRAMREARITAKLHHPNAVPVFDVVEHEGRPCLVMQYFPSSDLAELAAGDRPLPASEVARIGGDVAAALAAAHEVGIVHRDVKPANVLVAADGTAKISDFGIAHAVGDASLTSTGLVTGTPAYLAPEVARGEGATPASDVFSLGSTLYTVLEGRTPFGTHENSMALLHRVASGQTDPPQRSGALTPLLVRMLAAGPQDRPTMAQVAHELQRLGPQPTTAEATPADAVDRTSVLPAVTPGAATPAALAPVAAVPVADDVAHVDEDPLWQFREADGTVPEPGEGRRRRRGPLLAVAALVALLAVVGIGYLARQGDPPAAADPQRSAVASPSTSAPPSTTKPSSAAPSTSAPASKTPSATPTEKTAPASPQPAGGAPTASQLAAALKDYYALLPGNRDAGWARLTPRYQRTTAGSRSTYESFWGAIDRVQVSDVKASAPDTVTATLRYDYADGRVYVERTAYRLLEQGGVLKIDRSTVLSSEQR